MSKGELPLLHPREQRPDSDRVAQWNARPKLPWSLSSLFGSEIKPRAYLFAKHTEFFSNKTDTYACPCLPPLSRKMLLMTLVSNCQGLTRY